MSSRDATLYQVSVCCIHDCLFALLTALEHLEVKITNEVREYQVLAAGHVLLLFKISIFSDDDMSSRS